MPTITHRTVDGEFLLLGYHETPSIMRSDLIPMRTHGTWTPSFPHIAFVPTAGEIARNSDRTASSGGHDWTLDVILWQLWTRYPRYITAAVVGVLTLFTLVVWMCGRQSASSIMAEPRSAQTSKRGMRSFWPLVEEEVPDGWMPVGKILYDPHAILGRGCEGTIVYKYVHFSPYFYSPGVNRAIIIF
uniref:Uncharacterized protein n=1 Tax=Plectus sambesii TaxID=2011161 RepID=A0A914V0C8_9BILA